MVIDNMIGKFAVLIGPVLIGCVGLILEAAGFSFDIAARAGIASISILFLGGPVGSVLLKKLTLHSMIQSCCIHGEFLYV